MDVSAYSTTLSYFFKSFITTMSRMCGKSFNMRKSFFMSISIPSSSGGGVFFMISTPYGSTQSFDSLLARRSSNIFWSRMAYSSHRVG